jgi:hypothetical protein
MTEWRDVPGYEGWYQASDDGQVRSVDRAMVYSNGQKVSLRGKVLRLQLHNGRPQITLARNRTRAVRQISHLVMEAFVGPRPAGLYVLHWDDDPTNNHLSNLRYGNQSENKRDAVRNGIHHKARMTSCAQGHEYTDDNTYWINRKDKPPIRRCRICAKAWNQKWYGQKKRVA